MGFNIGDKVIRDYKNGMYASIGTVVNITKKRGDVVVDYGHYKETYRSDGTERCVSNCFRDKKLKYRVQNWRLTKEEYEARRERFLSLPGRLLNTEATFTRCLKPLPPDEVIFRALLTAEGAKPKSLGGWGHSPDGHYIVYAYVCEHSRLDENVLDALIMISSEQFDFGAFDWSREAVERAVRNIEGGAAWDAPGKQRPQAVRDRLDWAAVRRSQNVSREYIKKRRFFFAGTDGARQPFKEPYRAKTPKEKEERDERRRKRKYAPWLFAAEA